MAARRMRRGGRGAGGASGSSKVARSCACVLMVSVRPEAMRRGALEGGERGPVADQRLYAARLGGDERRRCSRRPAKDLDQCGALYRGQRADGICSQDGGKSSSTSPGGVPDVAQAISRALQASAAQPLTPRAKKKQQALAPSCPLRAVVAGLAVVPSLQHAARLRRLSGASLANPAATEVNVAATGLSIAW